MTAFLRWAGLAMATLFAVLLLAVPANAQTNGRLRCESWQFRPSQCPVPGIVDANIVNVIAGDCRSGNWGWDRGGVFVDNGCRAIFNVVTRGSGGGFPGGGYPGGGGGWGGGGRPGGGPMAGQLVRCESWQFRPARCPANTRGGVRIQRVIAGDCRPGNWGSDRNGIWVNNGCRAEFVAGSGGGGGGNSWGGNPGFQTVECNSINYRPARCQINGARNVQIDRVLGGECIQGRSWGFDRNSIWVNDGCRARFRVL